MAYTSDLRIKNLFKDIHLEVIKELSEKGIESKPVLRVFDESAEDSKLFEEGGLTFKDPYVNLKLGSNDGGWILNSEPLVIVEGTFGTERGQFGDGQLNRFSHSAGVAMNGFIGVTIVPFKGESYSKTGSIPSGINNEKIKLKYAKVHNGFLIGALKISEKEKGWFLVIDAYDKQTLVDLIVESTKERLELPNYLNDIIARILLDMQQTYGDARYGERSNQVLTKLYNTDKELISNRSRMYTQNIAALTTSQKRDGHGLLGKNLIEIYLTEGEMKYFAIFIRLTQADINNLKERNSKELKYIFNHPRVSVKCFNDLYFKDERLKSNLENIRRTNLFQDRQTVLIQRIQSAFNEGLIRIKV